MSPSISRHVALIADSIQGHLVGDNACWSKEANRFTLAERGVTVTARRTRFLQN